MAFDRKRGLLAALEDFSEGGASGPADDDALLSAQVESDGAVESSDEKFQDVQDTREAMEELEEEGERLEGLIDNVEATGDGYNDPELTEREATFVAAEANDIYRRLGIQRSRMPATESFASPSSRKLATKIALEDWKEKAKEIGKAILEYIKQLIQKLVSAWQNLVGTADKLKKTADELGKKVAELKGNPTAKTFKNASLAKAFGFGKGSSSDLVSKIIRNHAAAGAAMKDASKDFENFAKDLGEKKSTEDVQGAIASLQGKLKGRFGGVRAAEGGAWEWLKGAADQGAAKLIHGSSPAVIGPFIGGVSVIVTPTEDGIKVKTETAEFKGGDECPTADKGNLNFVLTDIKEVLKVIDATKDSAGKIKQFGAQIANSVEKGASMMDRAKDAVGQADEGTSAGNGFRKAALSTASSYAAIYEIIPRYNVTAVAKAVQYVSACVANYSTAAEKK